MDTSKNKTFLVFKGIKCLLKGIRRYAFIIVAALLIDLSNAYYDECRMINNTRNFDEQEQLVDDDTDK